MHCLKAGSEVWHFINFCGAGETLLCHSLVQIVNELIKEGHYIQIVTNATISKKIDEFINSDIDLSHLFFKCSCITGS